MHILRPRTDFSLILFVLAPLIGAVLIAISRMEDYRHDVFDVAVGSLLGLSIAYLSYRRYYPALRSIACDVPISASEDEDMRNVSQDGREYGVIRQSGVMTDDPGEDDDAVPLRDVGPLAERDLETGIR